MSFQVEHPTIGQSASTQLQEWLNHAAFGHLKKVLLAHQKTHMLASLEQAVKTDRYPLKEQQRTAELELARRYETAIAVLDEIAKQTEFNDIKIT